MEKEVSIVLSVERRNHRKLAQEWYGLTDEQMKDCDVHHNPPRHQGGRNIPEHLFVYHNTLHSAVHGGEFILWAREGGKKGAAAQPREARVKNGTNNSRALNAHPNTHLNRVETGRKTGSRNAERMNSHPNTTKSKIENGKRSGAKNGKENGKVRSKNVVVTNLITGDKKEYSSVHEAARSLSLHRGAVCAVARGERKSHKGYAAEYTLPEG